MYILYGKGAGLKLTLYLFTTSSLMMKVNTRILTDDSFEKGFAMNAFNSEKINFDTKSDRFTKNIPFGDIYHSSKKLSKFQHFASPRAQIPHSDMFFKEQ